MDVNSARWEPALTEGHARHAPLPKGVSPGEPRDSNTRKIFDFQSSLEPSGGFGKGPEKSSDGMHGKQTQQKHLFHTCGSPGAREGREPFPLLGVAAGGRGGGRGVAGGKGLLSFSK